MDEKPNHKPWNPWELPVGDLARVNAAAAPGELSPLASQRLDAGLQRLANHFGQSPAKPDAAMFGYLRDALLPDHQSRPEDVERGISPAIIVRKNEIGRQGLIGFPGFTATPREFHDRVSTWTPEAGEKRTIADVVAQALGAKDWQEMYPAYNQQFAREQALRAEEHQRRRDTPDVHAELRLGEHALEVAIAGKKLRGGLDTERVVATFSKMQDIHAVAVDIYKGLEAEGLVSTDRARSVQGGMRWHREQLQKPSAEQPLGDWSPAATAGLRGIHDLTKTLAWERRNEGGPQTEVILKAEQKMELLGHAWEAAKQPKDTQVPHILRKVAEIDNPPVIQPVVEPAVVAVKPTAELYIMLARGPRQGGLEAEAVA